MSTVIPHPQLRLNKILSQLTLKTNHINVNECSSTTSTVGKIIKCKAAIAWKKWDEKEKEPLTIEEVEVDVPHENEVRIKLLYSGVCHSDWHSLSGRTYSKFPLIFGHEGVGVVESIGSKVESVKAGDVVIPLWLPQCNKCKTCLSQKSNVCDEALWNHTMKDKSVRFKSCSYPQQNIYQFIGTATFSQYTVLPEVNVVKINKNVLVHNLGKEVCLIACGVSTGIGSVRNTMNVKKDSTVAVFGLGGIGLSVVMGCRMVGCKKIIGIDINPKKFNIAKQIGCTQCINPLDYPNQDIKDIIMNETNGNGVDYSFECIGLTKTMESALSCCAKWGQSCIVGIAPDSAKVCIKPIDLVVGRTWKGALFGGIKGKDDIPQIVNEYLNGDIDIKTLVTDVLPLSRINEGFWFMKNKKYDKIRTVIDLWK